MFSGDEMFEKEELYGSSESATFPSSSQPNINGYLTGMCEGKLYEILTNKKNNSHFPIEATSRMFRDVNQRKNQIRSTSITVVVSSVR